MYQHLGVGLFVIKPRISLCNQITKSDKALLVYISIDAGSGLVHLIK